MAVAANDFDKPLEWENIENGYRTHKMQKHYKKNFKMWSAV